MADARPLIFIDPYPRSEAMVFTSDAQATLNSLGRVVSHFGSRAPDELVESILPDVSIVVGQTAMPKDRLDRAPILKAILNVKANWEPNIDYQEAQARGIYVLSAAPAMAPAVAEACIGYAIDLARRTLDAGRAFRAGNEAYGIKGGNDSYSLYDARVGLIGFGNLARELVPLLRPFGCRIIANDPWLSERYLATWGVASSDLETVLRESRFLFILAGATTENERFLDRSKLEMIRDDASVILVSRAEVVEFDAFLELAQAGRFRAAIDVFPQEPVPADAYFRGFDRILFTAHRAGGIWASYARIRDMMVDDIRQILAGHPPLRMQRAEPRQAAIIRSR